MYRRHPIIPWHNTYRILDTVRVQGRLELEGALSGLLAPAHWISLSLPTVGAVCVWYVLYLYTVCRHLEVQITKSRHP